MGEHKTGKLIRERGGRQTTYWFRNGKKGTSYIRGKFNIMSEKGKRARNLGDDTTHTRKMGGLGRTVAFLYLFTLTSTPFGYPLLISGGVEGKEEMRCLSPEKKRK